MNEKRNTCWKESRWLIGLFAFVIVGLGAMIVGRGFGPDRKNQQVSGCAESRAESNKQTKTTGADKTRLSQAGKTLESNREKKQKKQRPNINVVFRLMEVRNGEKRALQSRPPLRPGKALYRFYPTGPKRFSCVESLRDWKGSVEEGITLEAKLPAGEYYVSSYPRPKWPYFCNTIVKIHEEPEQQEMELLNTHQAPLASHIRFMEKRNGQVSTIHLYDPGSIWGYQILYWNRDRAKWYGQREADASKNRDLVEYNDKTEKWEIREDASSAARRRGPIRTRWYLPPGKVRVKLSPTYRWPVRCDQVLEIDQNAGDQKVELVHHRKEWADCKLELVKGDGESIWSDLKVHVDKDVGIRRKIGMGHTASKSFETDKNGRAKFVVWSDIEKLTFEVSTYKTGKRQITVPVEKLKEGFRWEIKERPVMAEVKVQFRTEDGVTGLRYCQMLWMRSGDASCCVS
ncbi:MAG: hypothetical protein ACLFWL_19235, partial [Candidatus Brocadiia bacterium]